MHIARPLWCVVLGAIACRSGADLCSVVTSDSSDGSHSDSLDSAHDSSGGDSRGLDSGPGNSRGGDFCGEWTGIPDSEFGEGAYWKYSSLSGAYDYLALFGQVDMTTGLGSFSGIGNFTSPTDVGQDAFSLFQRTRGFHCDDAGLWLDSDSSSVSHLGPSEFSTWGEGVVCQLEQPLLIPRDPSLGDTWSGECRGTEQRLQGGSAQYDCSWSFTVASDASVATPAGSWQTLDISVVEVSPCAYYKLGSYSLARGAGIVAMSRSGPVGADASVDAGPGYQLLAFE